MPFVRENPTDVFTELDETKPIIQQVPPQADIVHPPQILTVWDDATLANIGVYRYTPVTPVGGLTPSSVSYQRISGVVTQILSYNLTVDTLKAYSAAVRFSKETGNITLMGSTVYTDRESQSLIMGAYVSSTRDPNFIAKWKTPSGFVTLDAAAIDAIASAVSTHVEACFAKEADVSAAIDAGTITTLAQIDSEYDF